ncbi:MAG: hypothetical protein ACFFA3_21625, partial [Promethearchaeota archaeon]
IDSLEFSMFQYDPLDNNASDGILFYFDTFLNIGSHSFMIDCSDGKFINSTVLISGPDVDPFIGIDSPILLYPFQHAEIPASIINFTWLSLNVSFGLVNYTIQISNTNDFVSLLYEVTDILETNNITSVQINVDQPSGVYYWRVIPTFSYFEGEASDIFVLYIFRNNFAPILISDTIYPLSGNQRTIFKFTITYQDLDNNAPLFLRIIINGIPFLMEKENPSDTNYTDGCIYQFLTLLKPSKQAYTYSFECFDGSYSYSTSSYQGPIVSNDATIHDRDDGLKNRDMENILTISIILILSIGIIVPSILITEIKIKKIKTNISKGSKTDINPKNSISKKNK